MECFSINMRLGLVCVGLVAINTLFTFGMAVVFINKNLKK